MNTLFAGAHDDRCVCRSRSERSVSVVYHGGAMLENMWAIIFSGKAAVYMDRLFTKKTEGCDYCLGGAPTPRLTTYRLKSHSDHTARMRASRDVSSHNLVIIMHPGSAWRLLTAAGRTALKEREVVYQQDGKVATK